MSQHDPNSSNSIKKDRDLSNESADGEQPPQNSDNGSQLSSTPTIHQSNKIVQIDTDNILLSGATHNVRNVVQTKNNSIHPALTPLTSTPTYVPVQSTLDLGDNLAKDVLPVHELWIERVYDRKFVGNDPTDYIINAIFFDQVINICKTYLIRHGTPLEKDIWTLYYEQSLFYGREVTLRYVADQIGVPENTVHQAHGRLMKKLQKRVIN